MNKWNFAVIIIVMMVLTVPAVEASFWSNIAKNLKQVQQKTPSGIVNINRQQPLQQTQPAAPSKQQSQSQLQQAPQQQHKGFQAQYPIILIHGWNGNPSSLSELQNQLASDSIADNKGIITASSSTNQICPQGWSKAVSVNFEYYDPLKNQGIHVYAKKLATAVEIVKSCTGSQQVDIVAHSMGGLVSRDFMTNYGSNVHRLIMLETPNYGSTLEGVASNIFNPTTIQNKLGYDALWLLPQNNFLNWLNGVDCNSRSKMYNIASREFFEAEFTQTDAEIAGKNRDGCRPTSPPIMSITVSPTDAFLYNTAYAEISGCSHTELISPSNCPQAYYPVKNYLLQ